MLSRATISAETRLIARRLLLDIAFLLFAASTSVTASQRTAPDALKSHLGLENKLDTRLQSFDAGGRTLIQAVTDLAFEYQLPISLEYVDQAAIRQPLMLKARGLSVREIIVGLTEQLPVYRTSFAGGVVQIYSPRARNDPANILNTVIPHFVMNNADPQEASTKVLEALVHVAGERKAIVESTAIGSPFKVTVHMEKATVYQILDAIVGQLGMMMWTVTAPPGKLSVVEGDLWYIYPLDPPVWKGVVIDRLQGLFPSTKK